MFAYELQTECYIKNVILDNKYDSGIRIREEEDTS